MFLNILILSVLFVCLFITLVQCKFNAILANSLAKDTCVLEARRMKEVPKRKYKGTCIIFGSGVAGCLSAAIISKHFEKVIIIDPIPSNGDPNTYIAQTDQLHNFHPLSYEAFKSAWPNGILEKVFKSFGGRFTSASRFPYQFLTFAGPLQWDEKTPGIVNPKDFPITATMSRRGLHYVLRCLIENYTPNTTLIIGKPVKARFSRAGRIASDTSIEAIQVQHREGEKLEWIDCDLVIDCSAVYRVFRKLISDDKRFQEPKFERYSMNITYNTAYIDIHPSLIKKMPLPKHSSNKKINEIERIDQAGTISLINPIFTNLETYFFFARQESNKFVIGTMDYSKESKQISPHSLDSIQSFYQANYFAMFGKDVEPWFFNLMDYFRKNEEIMNKKVKFVKFTDIDSYSYDLANIPREQQSLPNNLILLGDSYTKLNPAYAQGAQKCSGESMILHSILLDNQQNEKGIQTSHIAKIVELFNNKRHHYSNRMFKMNRALDMAQPSVQLGNPHLSPKIGESERKNVKALWNYIAKTGDKEVGRLFFASTMIGSIAPATLMHPYYLIRIFYAKYFL